MSILRANLKHLYQRRLLCLWNILLVGAIAGLMVKSLTGPRADKGEFVMSFLLCFPIGLITAGLQKEILTKPFSFCLPGHRNIPRLFIFAVGAAVSVLMSLPFLNYPGLDFPYVLLVVCAAAFTGMAAYLLGVLPAMASSRAISLIGLLWSVILAMSFFDGHKLLEHAIVSSPAQIVVMGTLVAGLFWWWLSDASLARKYCATFTLGIFDAWSPEKVQKYQQARAAEQLAKMPQTYRAKFEGFFLTRMQKHEFLSKGRYAWGNLYALLGRALPLWHWGQPITWLLLVVFMGYFSLRQTAMSNFLFIAPVFALLHLDLLACRSILLPGGRNEKYFAAAVSSLAMTVLTSSFPAMLTLVSIPLERVLPAVTVRGITFTYRAMDLRYIYFSLGFAPMALVVATLFPRKMVPKMIIAIVVMYMGMFFVMVPANLFEIIPPVLLPALVPASWAGFLLILRYYCLRQSLVGQAKQY